MADLVRPRAVAPGGSIGLAAPAGPIDPERLARGEAELRERGFEVVYGDDIVARQGYLAGDDERRARELMDLVKDPRVDAILCVRGGYGCQRIVERLDASVVRRAAKPLVGYSDVTTLLCWQQRVAGLGGLHGPMLERKGGFDPVALDSLCQALRGEDAGRVLKGQGIRGSVAEGILCGGSLSMVVASLGTPWEIETRERLLLLEEVNEAPYRIDRMLHHLRAAEKLDGVLGVGIGGLVNCDTGKDERPNAEDVVCEILDSLGVPLVLELPFGHLAENHVWPFSGRARLDGEQGELTLLEASTDGPGVSRCGASR